MKSLVIDTSGAALSIALFEGQALVTGHHERIGRGHAEAVMIWIAALPGGGRADQILVGCGPGSFTGVRAGVAAAHGLSLGWDVPCRGFNSLALLAAALWGAEEGEALTAIDGGHGELFVQPFAAPLVRRLSEPVSLRAEAAAPLFAQARIIGNGAARLVEARGYGTACDGDADARYIWSLDPAELNLPVTPLYVRAPDAKPMPPC
jgi:tRNA threonylcarbamoyladenosine biosynthesis protein TsaB